MSEDEVRNERSKYDRVVVDLLQLRSRVDALECLSSGRDGYVEGWTAAARFLGISDQTCMDRLKRGQFPQPCEMVTFHRGGKAYTRPRWRRSDLVAYAEGT